MTRFLTKICIIMLPILTILSLQKTANADTDGKIIIEGVCYNDAEAVINIDLAGDDNVYSIQLDKSDIDTNGKYHKSLPAPAGDYTLLDIKVNGDEESDYSATTDVLTLQNNGDIKFSFTATCRPEYLNQEVEVVEDEPILTIPPDSVVKNEPDISAASPKKDATDKEKRDGDSQKTNAKFIHYFAIGIIIASVFIIIAAIIWYFFTKRE